ncbi:hypothetical protein L484_010727 [Morus notabilis]|uniref:Lachrymatory-factor synthase n=1 Tax=Morus notabilis TaxID=981085 RepID=W9RI27_9ROSA|nr:lachrymatory-factor synthase [Morus notabilis]EXB93399.1 hypothetical protein L484_010727 [Morus notabilis]
MAEEKSQEKWEGKVSAQLKGSKARDVWPFYADFLNLHKWLPSVDTCHLLDGPVTGLQPGVLRYAASTVTSPSGEATVKWAKEKLLELDPIQRRLKYEVLENNVGFKSWVATMQVLPIDGDEEGGSEITWSFSGDPVEGLSYEMMLAYYDSNVQSVAKTIEDSLSHQAQVN